MKNIKLFILLICTTQGVFGMDVDWKVVDTLQKDQRGPVRLQKITMPAERSETLVERSETLREEIIKRLEHELLNKIYKLANPENYGGPVEERLRYKKGTPGYAAQQQRAKLEEAASEQAYISQLDQMIAYVDKKIASIPHSAAL